MKLPSWRRWHIYGAGLVALATRVALADLPAESVIPGEQPPPTALPSEAALPPYAAALAAASSREEPAPLDPVAAGEPAPIDVAMQATPPTAEPPKDLPSEQTIPSSQAGATDADDANELPIKGSPDGIPWLRLNLRGHTAPVRALTFVDDGARICTAGEDKTMVVWGAAPNPAGGPPRWGYERTVRWQIQRGTRGRIYALAAAPSAIALAGEGAMGGAGEILLIDPKSGELSATLNDLQKGHRQVVVALSFAPGAAGNTLASLSMDGCLVHWSQSAEGLWKATRLSGPDAEAPGADAALIQRLTAGRTLAAVATVDDAHVVAPVYSRQENNRVVWRLELYDATSGAHHPLGDEQQSPHWDNVKSLAVSGDGHWLASADGGGYVYLWDLRATPARVRVLTRTQAFSLAFDAQGQRLAIGGDVAADGRSSHVEVWNVANFATPQRLAQFNSTGLVAACGLSPDGQTAAWTSGARAYARSLKGDAEQELPAGVTAPLKVAFPAEQPFHHLGIARSVANTTGGPVNQEFDTDLLRLNQVNRPQPGKWLPEDWLSQGWTVREEGAVAGQRSIWLYQAGARRARAPLTEERHGRLTSSCWIPGRGTGAAPFAAAIGTTGGGIFLVRPGAAGDATILRQFRGHTAAVTSLAVSRDLKYLASTSLDGTICVWPLADVSGDAPLVQRWGATFQGIDGALIANAVRPEGPLYFRGMRSGDRLVELRFVDITGSVRTVNAPDAMQAALQNASWETLMTFKFARGRAPATEFQLYPAWQQLATLFVADDGEWAYWSPAGYFDASFEGHKLFGWQINRGLEMLPDFFLAAQFRRQLERPAVMSQLLRRGSLEAAFQAAELESPASAEDAIVNSYRLTPEVEILSPRDGDVVNGRATLRARLSTDLAERLAPPKAFANGVVAISRRLVAEEVRDGQGQSTYEWELRMPSDPRVLLQVAAATENEVTGGAAVVVANQPPQPTSAPRIHVLTVGIDHYRDAQIPKLTTAVKSADDFVTLLRNRTPRLYQMDAVSLVDDRATKASWRWLTEDFSKQLARDASPDDVVVVFLSGHGVQAPGDAGYQFVAADARYADVMAGRYGDCLSIGDLAFLADVPCRKIVILNTCHGGVAPPLQHRELKSAVRALQGDMMLTLAASAGEEEAVEGRFVKRLLEALAGSADENRDGVVSFAETAAFVQTTVVADSMGDAVRQSPSAGPNELLPYVTAPLTRVGAQVAEGSATERAVLADLASHADRPHP